MEILIFCKYQTAKNYNCKLFPIHIHKCYFSSLFLLFLSLSIPKNVYTIVFKVTLRIRYQICEIQNDESNMAEKVLRNFHFFGKNLYTRFLGSSITNLRLDLQISKWIQVKNFMKLTWNLYFVNLCIYLFCRLSIRFCIVFRYYIKCCPILT